MESLQIIFDRYNCDKNSSFHNYCRQYESLLQDYRDKPIRLLEIGVFEGESLKIWRDVFPKAIKIIGVDINPICKMYENKDNSIFVEIGDATNGDFINSIQSKHGPFDIIIDDGSHINMHVIQTFEILFPLLNDNGLYIIEDTICFKSKEHIVPDYPNHLAYFGRYFTFLNQWRHDSTSGIRDNCVDPFKIQKTTSNVFEASIDMITYGISFIAISKKIRYHWIS